MIKRIVLLTCVFGAGMFLERIRRYQQELIDWHRTIINLENSMREWKKKGKDHR